MTRVVIAVDSLKGSIPADAAAREIASGWSSVEAEAEIELRPMADGGEGTIAAFLAAVPGATWIPMIVPAESGGEIETGWLLLPDGTGVVELASASGIEMLHGRLLPWDADTTGFGIAIRDALDFGVDRLILAIGSSASTDGGAGMLTALGVRMLDADGSPVRPGARGLGGIVDLDFSKLRDRPRAGAVVLTDVRNPLLGAAGAAVVYGPQKGFTVAELDEVNDRLAHYAAMMPVPPETPGAGVAGGTGFALLAWGAQLVPGADRVASMIGLETRSRTLTL